MKRATLTLMLLLLISQLHIANSLANEITVKVVDIDDKPAVGLAIYLLPLDAQQLDFVKPASPVVSQSEKAFLPHISVMEKGMSVNFINEDNITHHIYSVSSKNNFSFRIKKGDSKSVEQLSSIGKVLMGCNIHDWMSGYILVVDTPLYTKTDQLGEAVIDVPVSGRYQLVIWHPQLKEKDNQLSQEITLPGKNDFQVKLNTPIINENKQKNREDFDFLEDY